MEQRNSYVYRHRRLDTNEVFYVGIGKLKNFARAYKKDRRSIFWKNIVDKCGYEVEIISKSLSWDEACELEVFLISVYGRKDLGTGILVNLTEGGDGHVNPSQKERENRSKRMQGTSGVLSSTWGRKHTEEEKSRMRGKRESISGENHPFFGKKRPDVSLSMSKRIGELAPMYGKTAHNAKIVLDIETGIFYDSLKDASKAYNIKYDSLKKYLNGTYRNKTNLIYC